MPSDSLRQLLSEYPHLADLAWRPVPRRCSDARALDPGIAVAADCEPEECRRLFLEWRDRCTAGYLAEAVHQLELERAARPPVIQVTVTTSPGGTPRLQLYQAVAEKIREIAVPPPSWLSPQRLELPGSSRPSRRRVLVAARRAVKPASDASPEGSTGLEGSVPAWPAAADWWPVADPGLAPRVSVSEDDTPTVELPAVRYCPLPVTEVQAR